MEDNGGIVIPEIPKERSWNCCGDENSNDYLNEGKGEGGKEVLLKLKMEQEQPETEGKAKMITNICDLPRQVWLEIYENIDYPSYLNLRQVSHHFRHLINEYIGIRVSFTDACEENPEWFDFYCGVALNDVQFEDAANPEKYNFNRIFKYPGYLTDISFTGDTNFKLVQDILLNCHCIELVEMTMDCKFLEEGGDGQMKKKEILPGIDICSLAPPSKSYLKHVECLKLVPGVQNDDNLRSHVVLSILRGTNSRDSLRKVIFQCELSEEISLANVLTITAELMEKHPKLEAFFMALLNDEYLLSSDEGRKYSHFMDLKSSTSSDGEKTGDPNQLEYFRNRITATGKYLQIKKIGLAMLNANMRLIWSDFLRTQHKLVHLSLTVTIGEGTFSQELFDTFSGTLEQLAIRGKFEVAFDFQHVSNCLHLKEICLHNLQENGGGGIIPKCVNLPQVADGLESLILFQVVVRTEELMDTVAKLEKLHTLVVFKCGHAAGETGIGLECLRLILHKRSLQSILMVQFICGSTTEAEALAGILYDMSQDRENQSGQQQRRGRRGNPGELEEFPPDHVENVLDLPIVEDGGDVLLFPIVGGHGHGREHPAEAEVHAAGERPASRGRNQRNIVVGPVVEEVAEAEAAGCSAAPPLASAVEITDVTEEEAEKKTENPREFSSTPEDFPPLPEPEPERIQPSPNNCAVLNELLQNDSDDDDDDDDDDGDLEVDEIRINLVLNPDPNNNNQNNNGIINNNNDNPGPLNMLQNILEQAFANPGQAQRNHPNLQNHLQLNQIQQDFDDDVELILDVDNDGIGPVLDLFAAEQLAREHNVQVGFILDGVIDIMNEEVVRSKWLCVEDEEGHITYTLKISVEL